MALTVTCRCGKWFSAPDHLAGTTAACPSCGSPIAIGGSAPASPARQAVQASAPVKKQAGPAGLVVACACGKSYKAPESLRGQSLPCPACGRPIPIPAAVAQPAVGAFGLDPLASNDPLADPLMTASLTGPSVAFPSGHDPLGRPMPAAPYGAAPLGQQAMYGSQSDGPNWVIIGSIGGVALVLLILVGVIAATSFSSIGTTPVAANTSPPASLSPAVEPVPSPAPTAAASPVPSPDATAAIPAASPMPGIPGTAPGAGTTTPPMGSSAGPTGTISATKAPTFGPGSVPTATASGTPTGGAPMASPPIASGSPPAAGSSAPPGGSSAGKGTTDKGGKMVKIISRKNPQNTFETLESVTPNPHGLATALPTWHGDSRAKLAGVLRVGDDGRTTMQGHYSWMHNILPFMGHQEIYDKFDLTKPLHDDRNMTFGCTLVPEFLVPGNPKQRWKGYPFEHLALTHFVGMSGIEDARNVVAGKLDRTDPRAGIFGYDRIAASSEITDGTSNTIMVIGVGELSNPWVMGGGSTIRGARQPYFDKLTGFGSHGQKGAITMMADGSVRLISENIDPAVFRAMCTMHGAESVDLPNAAPPFKAN
ncbi:MAG TPA: DUF1559 domain-containing protein [Pirellulaceae bacterium]|nr:DUF1559 domain-containing protein [Pirellulaceae bacterium]